MSEEYKKYLKKLKINKFLVTITQITILVIFILGWQFLSDKNLINTFITSSPKKVIMTIADLYKTNNLFNHIWVTSYETILSFTLSTILGLLIAILLWYSKFLSKVLDPYLTILNSLPKVSLSPILIIWIGANIKSIITISILVSLIITIITIYNGFINVEKTKINLLKSQQATKYQILKYLIICFISWSISCIIIIFNIFFYMIINVKFCAGSNDIFNFSNQFI